MLGWPYELAATFVWWLPGNWVTQRAYTHNIMSDRASRIFTFHIAEMSFLFSVIVTRTKRQAL